MKSKQDKILFDILDELNYYKSNNRQEVLQKNIELRLSKSLSSYYQELILDLNSLLSYSDKSVMKRILKFES